MKVSGNAQVDAVSGACFTLAVVLFIFRIRNYMSGGNPYALLETFTVPISIGASALALWWGSSIGRRFLQFFTGLALVIGSGWLIAGAMREPTIIGLGMMPEVFVLVIFAVSFWTLTFSRSLDNEIQRRKEKRRIG